jgi:signal transduction histidine kinase
LGLTHTYTIISTHKGAIAVESTPGQGTTFHVTLPVASTASASSPSA